MDAGIVDGSELLVKDLGHQISWKTVFLVEYVSRRVKVVNSWLELTRLKGWSTCDTPHIVLLPRIHLGWPCLSQHVATVCILHFFSFFPGIYATLRFVYTLVMIHFVKREFETLLWVIRPYSLGLG